MKVYIHYEGLCGPPITIATTLTNETSSQLILSLTEKYYNKYQIKLDPSCLYLSFHDDNKKINLFGNEIISQLVCDKDDIFILDCKSREVNATSKTEEIAPSNSNINTTRSRTSNTKTESESVEKVIVEKKIDNVKIKKSNELVTRLKEIKSQFDRKMFRQARKLCEDALKTMSSNDKDLLIIQTEIAIETNVFDLAISNATKISKLYPTESYNHYLLGKSLCAGERFEEAELALEKALSLHKSSSSKKSKTALENQMFELDIVACQAECLFASGSHVEAADLINARVGRPGTEKHIPILVAYATFAMQYDKIEESMRALLNAIVLDQKNKKTRAVLSKLLQTEKGYQQLTIQLPPNEQAAVAYAFIAIIAKESGAIESCCKLLTQALKTKPSVANYALNLAHAYEIVHDYTKSMQIMVDFCKSNDTLRVGASGFSCKDLLDILPEDIKSNGYPVSTSPTHSVTWIEEEKDKGMCVSNPIGDIDQVDGVINAGQSYQEKLGDDDLDLLALAFTMAKILYLQGRISVLPLLFQVIEPTRLMSKVSCHETTIRNEHAYYQSIAQILSTRIHTHPILSAPEVAFSDPLTSTIPALITLRNENPIYICGDSHSLSPSWNVVTIAGKERMIIPKLVTGVKHWHLRPDSTFYPKINFFNTLKSIPDGSDVIFILGEIDCREGLLLALERDKYATIQEGMKHTVDIFVKVLAKLIQTRKFNVFIHPILPILKETRPIVVAYNDTYKEAIDKMKGVKWLDFFDEILTATSGCHWKEEEDIANINVRTDLKLDGTHINPKYISILEKSINSVI